MGLGVPALKHSLVELIITGKFMDHGELHPAKSFGKMPSALSSNVEGIYVRLYYSKLQTMCNRRGTSQIWIHGCNALPSTGQCY